MSSTYKAPHIRVAVGIVKNSRGDIFIAQREKHKHQGGFWEFPGGKIELGETVEQALGRELEEELGISPINTQRFCVLTHEYPDIVVTLEVCVVGAFSGEPYGREGQLTQWVAQSTLPSVQFPAANRAIVAKLCLPQRIAIMAPSQNPDTFEQSLRVAIDQGAEAILLRPSDSKHMKNGERSISLATEQCAKHGMLLFVSSKLGLDHQYSVHLNAQHLTQLSERPRIKGAWLGASCHTLEECLHAESIGCDYVFLSPVCATSSHPEATPVGWELFKYCVSKINIPVFALGGMDESCMKSVLGHGGHGYAAIRSFQSK